MNFYKKTKPYIQFAILGFFMTFSFDGQVVAQYRGFTEILPEGLTLEDIELMKETARGKMENETVDTVLKWKNPASGNSGAVKLLRRFQLSERECMTNRHYLLLKNDEKRVLEATICREEGGEWVFHN
ncbi:MAG: hypothetical protein V3R64_04435 [Sphingomonadales bacterium]